MARSRSAGLIAVVVLAWGMVGVGHAVAAPPANDDFRDAKVIRRLPFEHRTNTRDATTQARDPRCAGRGHTVWYSFTPRSDGWVVAETVGSRFDTTLSAYTGEHGSLTKLGCNDDARGVTSRLFVEVTSGQAYHFMVGSCCRRSGGRLVFAIDESPAPCLGRVPTIVGTAGDDDIEGTSGRDVIAGLAGNDTISGLGGRDFICGDAGNDTIELKGTAAGGDGDDTITAATLGSSTLIGGGGSDTLRGGFGSDFLRGGPGDDVLRGGPGFDTLVDPEGANDLHGGAQGDTLLPGRGTGPVDGGGGFDFLAYGNFGIDGVTVDLSTGTAVVEGSFVQTVEAVEFVFGSRGADGFTGGPGRDFFEGGDGADTMTGGEGDDFLSGDDGSDVIVGSEGDDELFGGRGADTISGSDGDDELQGSSGRDELAGDAGDDFLAAGNGDDELDGGPDIDGLNGGNGTDSCVNGETAVRCEP